MKKSLLVFLVSSAMSGWALASTPVLEADQRLGENAIVANSDSVDSSYSIDQTEGMVTADDGSETNSIDHYPPQPYPPHPTPRPYPPHPYPPHPYPPHPYPPHPYPPHPYPPYPVSPCPGGRVGVTCFARNMNGQVFEAQSCFYETAQRDAVRACEQYSYGYCEPSGCRSGW